MSIPALSSWITMLNGSMLVIIPFTFTKVSLALDLASIIGIVPSLLSGEGALALRPIKVSGILLAFSPSSKRELFVPNANTPVAENI